MGKPVIGALTRLLRALTPSEQVAVDFYKDYGNTVVNPYARRQLDRPVRVNKGWSPPLYRTRLGID